MSADELVSAYVDGGISRRTLIRRLVAGGVSLGAAVSYAHLLSPGRAEAQSITNADFYRPEPGVALISKNLDATVGKGKLKLRVHVEEAATVLLIAKVSVGGKLKTVAKRQVVFTGLGVQQVTMKLTKKGRRLLSGMDKAQVAVFATATNNQGQIGQTGSRRKLK